MSQLELSPLDQRILGRIQSDFPLSHEPYAALARIVACSPAEAHERVLYLRAAGIIRRIGGSFAAQPLGYVSTLVAGRVDPACLEAAAARAGEFPEVTHNYEREDDYNLWFTVIAADRERLRRILRTVRAVPGVQALHDLPALRLFKINVDFRFEDTDPAATKEQPPKENRAAAPAAPLETDETDHRIICRACGDIDDTRTPFTELASRTGVAEDEVLVRLKRYRAHGAMRRFGAVLRHRAAGFGGNGMSVWKVRPEDVVRVGNTLASCPEISHCYERPPIADWPYNVFGMIHGKDRPGCLAIAKRISLELGRPEYRVLFSNREFKKTSMLYFPDALSETGRSGSNPAR